MKLNGLRVKEDGKSECRSVMVRIKSYDLPEREQTSIRSSITRNYGTFKQERANMTETATAVNDAVLAKKWATTDWDKARRTVERLQKRIVKASKKKQLYKVKALQKLLSRSHYAKLLAVKRVTENSGKRTAGTDGVVWKTKSNKYKAVLSLSSKRYHPKPLKRIYIPKPNGKLRPISIPTMKDRAMQILYAMTLEPIAETTADPNSYGFRKHRSTQDAIEQIFCCVAKRKSAKWILDFDIKGCFDNISHEWLLDNIPISRRILRKWLKAGYIFDDRYNTVTAGTPQGGNISPILANMTLDGLEKELKRKFNHCKSKYIGNNPKVNLIRYADDGIVTGTNKETIEEAKTIIENFLKERGLTLSNEKTKIVHIDEGFNFLGKNIRKYNGKLIIKPSKENVKAFLDNIRTVIRKHRTTKTDELIRMLNPKIIGWANYHRHSCSYKTFENVDNGIWKAIWYWCKRRHPNKGRKWIANKYYKQVGTRSWTFHSEQIFLRRMQYIRVKRHVKIRAKANPYDPEYAEYFKERLVKRKQLC